MAEKKASKRPLCEKLAMAEQDKKFDLSYFIDDKAAIFQILLLYGKELRTLQQQIILSSTIADKEQCYNYLENVVIGLSDSSDDVREFCGMAQKLINNKEIDFLHFLELFVDGADGMSEVQINHHFSKKNEELLQNRKSVAQKRNSQFTRCFQTAHNIEIEKKYAGKGQGSGRAQVWNNCHCLSEKTSEQAFKTKYKEWKDHLPPEEQIAKISELAPCTWNGTYCK